MLETIRISAAGYPSRWVYEDFIHRYLMLLPSGQIRRDDMRAMCTSILERTIKVCQGGGVGQGCQGGGVGQGCQGGMVEFFDRYGM